MTLSVAADIATRKLSIDDTVGLAKRSGVDHIDIFDLEILLYGKRKVRRALKAHGVTISCLIASASFLSKFERAVRRRLNKLIRLARDLDVTRLMIVPGDVILHPKRFEKLHRETKLDRYSRGFRLAVELATPQGIEVLLEDTPIISSSLSAARDCRDLLDQVPGLGFVFDTANMIVAGDDTLDFYEVLKHRVTYVHLKDVLVTDDGKGDLTVDGRHLRACRWGNGIVPIRAVLDRLDADGYQGPIAIEYGFRAKHAEAHEEELAIVMAFATSVKNN